MLGRHRRQGIHREVGDTWGVLGDIRRRKKTQEELGKTSEGTGRLESDRET